MIIDCHGHYTTAPSELEAWRKRQIAAFEGRSTRPGRSELVIRDAAISPADDERGGLAA